MSPRQYRRSLVLRSIAFVFLLAVGVKSTPNDAAGNKDTSILDVLVIGAGWAGMGAADHISRNSNASLLVLEAAEETGGRTRARLVGDRNGPGQYVVELGAMFITGVGGVNEHEEYGENKIHELAVRSGLKTDRQVDKLDIVFDTNGEEADLDGKLRKKLKSALDCVYDSMEDPIEKKMTLQDCGWDPKTKVEKALYPALQECQAGESFADWLTGLIWSEQNNLSIEQENPRGYGSLLDFMMEDNESFDNDRIAFNAFVDKISYHGDTVVVSTRDGRVFRSKQVISTLPLGVLQQRHKDLFEPPLNNELSDTLDPDTARVEMVNITKVFVQFPAVWWDNNAKRWVSSKGGGELASWRNLNHDDFIKGSNLLMTIFSDPWSAKYEALSDDDAEREVMKYLRSQHPNTEIPNPSSFYITRHGLDETRFGAYMGSISDSCSDILHFYNMFAEPLRSSNGNAKVRFAGEAHCPAFVGYTHGALLSGIEVAARYLYDVGLGKDPREDMNLNMCHEIADPSCRDYLGLGGHDFCFFHMLCC